MAIIKKPMKEYNGTGWDQICLDACRSISFGLTADATTGARTVPFNRVFTKAEGFDCDTSIAEISGGNIKLLETGVYLFTSRLQINGTMGGRGMIYADGGTTPTEELWHLAGYKLLASLNAFVHGTGTGVRLFEANRIILNNFEIEGYGSGVTIQKYGTVLTVMYLGTGE